MRVIKKTTHHTPEHTPGFSERLDHVCSLAQLPSYGRVSALARMANISPQAATRMWSWDRPPKQKENFDSLLHHLSTTIKRHTGTTITPYKLGKYLLKGENAPFQLTATSAVFQAQIYLKVQSIGNELGVDIYKEIEPTNLEELLNEAVIYCSYEDVKLDSLSTKMELTKLIVNALKK